MNGRRVRMSDEKTKRRHSKHIFRVFILLGLVFAVLLVVRYLLIPPGWGEHGNFRTGAVAEVISIEPMFGDEWSCRKCHEGRWNERYKDTHATVPCESCHDALATHVKDGKRVSEMAIHRSYELCARCHRQIQGRPESHPQVKIDEHLSEQGGSMSPHACLDCHNPHSPMDGLR
jgi:hypothetical protein